MSDGDTSRETITVDDLSASGKPSTPSGDQALATAVAEALAPDYTLREHLGRGGFGSVFSAIHTNTGQSVAVKILQTKPTWSSEVVSARIARFERETELCATLRHPNIVRLLHKGHTTSQIYYAIYELVPGETLRALLRREGQLSVERVADLMSQVLDAVATAHAAGVVHRDLKPANIMVVDTGLTVHVKVLDFGISTLTVEARDAGFHEVTRTFELVGTPQYCAPEQLRGDLPTPKTDLYAWGLVFLECLTGQRAVDGATPAEIYNQHLSSVEVALPSAIVGHPLGNFLRRVLMKNPAGRAGDAARLHEEFRQLPLGDLVGTLAAVPPTTDRTLTWSGPEAQTERRQVTVIALNLRLLPVTSQLSDPDVLDPLLRDQLSLCRDALGRYGGSITGGLGDSLVSMFGYPTASDTDARRAVRTVLELSEEIRRRSERLQSTQSLALQFRLGIHTGPMTVTQGQAPTGITATRALTLSAAAEADTIVVSPDSRPLLAPFAELEAGPAVSVSGAAAPVSTSRLVGERHGEALAFGPGQPSPGQFIGRQSELTRLVAKLAASGTSSTASGSLVVGEAGIGKSRLVREFLTLARVDGRTVLECACLAEQRNVALSPVLPVLRQRLHVRDIAPAEAGAAIAAALDDFGLDPARFVPIVCVWLSVPLPDGFEPAAMAPFRQRELLLEALVAILTKSDGGPSSIILIEDLHWADPTTLRLINDLLAAQVATVPFLMCTARPQFRTPWDDDAMPTIDLDRLSLSDARALASQTWTASDPPSPDVLSAIAERADGIPLFVEELTRMVADGEHRPHDLSAIPITLRDSLAARLDQLGTARSIAQVASALGREFDSDVLAAAANDDLLSVKTAIDRLTDAKLIYRRRLVTGSTYVFRHALIQEAAYDSMPREARQGIHAKLVEALEGRFGDSPHSVPSELARHHAGAGAFDAAVRSGTQAAQQSLDKSSNEEALAQVDQVAAWLTQLPDDTQTDAELRLNGIRLQALMSAQGWAAEEVRSLAERSRELLNQTETVDNTVWVLFGLFMHYHVASKRAECREVADELVAFADRIGDTSVQSVACTAKGVHFYAEGRFLDSEPWLDKALAHYDPTRHRDQGSVYGMDCRVWATSQQALVQWAIGRTRRALQLANEAIAWARQIEHVPSLGIALLYISQIHQMSGDRPSVRARTDELLEASNTYGLPAFEGYGATLASWASGDREGVAAVIRTLRSLDCNLILTYYGSFLADIEADAGHWPDALAHTDEWLRACDEFDEHVFEPELERRRALYAMRLDPADEPLARRSLMRARTLARDSGAHRFEALAIRDELRAFGADDALEARLQDIHCEYPDLHPHDAQPATPAEDAG